MGGYSQPLAQSERYPPHLCRSDRGCGWTGTLLPRPQGSGIDPVTPRLPHQRRVTAEDHDSVDGATFAIAITSANPALRSDPSRRRSSFCEGPVPGAGAMEGFDSIPTHSGPHLAVTSLPVVLLSPRETNLTLCVPRYFCEETYVLMHGDPSWAGHGVLRRLTLEPALPRCTLKQKSFERDGLQQELPWALAAAKGSWGNALPARTTADPEWKVKSSVEWHVHHRFINGCGCAVQLPAHAGSSSIL